jgi:tetratricopeptide (TPR) repeat protein
LGAISRRSFKTPLAQRLPADNLQVKAAAMNHALKLRGHGKRDPRKRQLPALAAAAFLLAQALGASGQSGQRAPASPSPTGELRAAKLMEFTLAAKNADAQEWSKLDKVYSDLDIKYPHDAAVEGEWAQYLWDRGEKLLAMEKWETVTKMDPKNAPALSSLGNGYLGMGKIKQAADCLTRASESAPANAAYHFDLANVLFLFRHDLLDAAAPDESRVIQRALNHFGEAARLEPLNIEYAKGYADTFFYAKPPDWTTALAAWTHYLEITPHKDFAYSNLARVHMKMGQKEEARACLAQIHGAEFDRLKARLNQRIDTE